MARTSRNWDTIIQDLAQAAAGAAKNAAIIPLLQNTPAAILATRELLVGKPAGPGGGSPSVIGVMEQWTTAKTAKLTTNAEYRAALKDGRELALTCVSTLKPVLGRTWNSLWQGIGFTNGSLRIPRKAAGTLRELAGYYDSNPSRQVSGVNGMDCTATACRAAADAIDNARATRNAAKGAATGAKRAFAAGMKAGRQRLIGLRAELSQLLPPNDARWYSYGFEKPAYQATPAMPEDLTSHAAGTGAVRYEWADSPRADNYRFVLKDTAGNVLVEQLVNENSIFVENLPSGSTVTGEVSACNKTGESRPTVTVTATVEGESLPAPTPMPNVALPPAA